MHRTCWLRTRRIRGKSNELCCAGGSSSLVKLCRDTVHANPGTLYWTHQKTTHKTYTHIHPHSKPSHTRIHINTHRTANDFEQEHFLMSMFDVVHTYSVYWLGNLSVVCDPNNFVFLPNKLTRMCTIKMSEWQCFACLLIIRSAQHD